jgi:hypothetical protein
MKKLFLYVFLAFVAFSTMSCSQNYSNGERIGFVTKFSQKGLIWKSWECEVNLTQTGMNTSSLFDCSLDNDQKGTDEYDKLVATLDSAAIYGWKVKMKYHEVFGWNWFQNRGETDYFISAVQVLDKTMVNNIKDITNPNRNRGGGDTTNATTVYIIVVDPKDIKDLTKYSR